MNKFLVLVGGRKYSLTIGGNILLVVLLGINWISEGSWLTGFLGLNCGYLGANLTTKYLSLRKNGGG